MRTNMIHVSLCVGACLCVCVCFGWGAEAPLWDMDNLQLVPNNQKKKNVGSPCEIGTVDIIGLRCHLCITFFSRSAAQRFM